MEGPWRPTFTPSRAQTDVSRTSTSLTYPTPTQHSSGYSSTFTPKAISPPDHLSNFSTQSISTTSWPSAGSPVVNCHADRTAGGTCTSVYNTHHDSPNIDKPSSISEETIPVSGIPGNVHPGPGEPKVSLGNPQNPRPDFESQSHLAAPTGTSQPDPASDDHSAHNNPIINPGTFSQVSVGLMDQQQSAPDRGGGRQTLLTESQSAPVDGDSISGSQASGSQNRDSQVHSTGISNPREPGQIFDSLAPLPPSKVVVGPFTTDFTPPQSCTTLGHFAAFVTDPPLKARWTFKRGQLCADVDIADGCLPTQFMETFSQKLGSGNQLETIPVFSPGDRCPVGYEGACTMVPQTQMTDLQGKTLAWAALRYGEMAIGCCPSGYACYGGGRSCISTAYAGATLVRSSCATQTDDSSPLTIASDARGYAFDVQMIYITHETLPGAPTEGHDLSTGAKAAIGIIIPLVVLGLAIGGLFFYKRKKRRAATDIEHLAPAEDTAISPNEAPDQTTLQTEKEENEKKVVETPLYEISSDVVMEMEGDNSFAPLEMDADQHIPHDTL